VLGKSEVDSEVVMAKESIAKKGWTSEILKRQHPAGWWLNGDSLYRPKYLSTNWMLLVLSDLGVTRSDIRIDRACNLWIARFAKKDGGFGTDDMRMSELCLVGNTTRALIRFGYEEHPKVKSAIDWLVSRQKENGGWHCWGKNGVIDAWEGMSVFAVYPKHRWNKRIKRSVEMGAEFYLQKEMHKQGAYYGPWYRFHYPTHYYYDLLVGLDFMTALGYGRDKRLRFAISLLKDKRRTDGKWNLDAIHPDLEGSYAGWYKKRPPTPFALEQAGEPSKIITLRALQILNRLDGTA
jgi:hypothetical protein